MGYDSFLRIPKMEEQQVPDATVTEFNDSKESYADGEIDITDELEGILGIENEEKLPGNKIHGHLGWDFMDWESGYHNAEEEDEEDERDQKLVHTGKCFEEESEYNQVVKKENLGFWELDDEKSVSLNLNLNYQDVLDAWSDRGPLWADDYSISMASNGYYMGEVPVMEEERTRREASVLRYKEKRQTRLFSKKIRYQVRKLNADKRPRLKGRFVKRVS
ncbi:protein CHLOROPLAST IMPORT APPARATUS 2 [Durio zibethinus]|uniref:Protein CHLOROPLAST IMPORT APPARATUS 2 n=1 Tax=Durio zibethinus TaxID=66656 RepID=A0A6P5XV26_DURZI|nr:protein CHLOROPLAST IMPORT APPARATUS 2 [Durio zibethinus]